MADSIAQAIAARPLPHVPIILLAASKLDLDALPADTLRTDALTPDWCSPCKPKPGAGTWPNFKSGSTIRPTPN